MISTRKDIRFVGVDRHASSHTYTALFTAQHLPGNTATFDLVAHVSCRIVVVSRLYFSLASIEGAIERFDLSNPELESACFRGILAAKCNLWWAIRKHFENFAVYKSVSSNITGTRSLVPVLVTSHIWKLRFTTFPPV